MQLSNPIARITAAIILVFSLVLVSGIVGEIAEQGFQVLNIMIGAALTYLFVAQKQKPQ